MNLSASLVLFHNDPNQFSSVIRCFLQSCDGILYVVDNSNPPLKHDLFFNPRVKYFHYGTNLGFGKAHNKAIALTTSELHLLLNPDIVFGPDVLFDLCSFLEANRDVGAVMPRINYPDGTLQRLCKMLPTPIDLILRRFIPFNFLKQKLNYTYELHELPQNKPSCVPTLSGCFLIMPTNILSKIGGFDERFFMYMEDVDLIRRIGDVAKIVYLPSSCVVHSYAKGSYFNSKLLGYHLRSAILYFFKWGWFFDSVRRSRNSEVKTRLEGFLLQDRFNSH